MIKITVNEIGRRKDCGIKKGKDRQKGRRMRRKQVGLKCQASPDRNEHKLEGNVFPLFFSFIFEMDYSIF